MVRHDAAGDDLRYEFIGKDRLPGGESYPIKRSALDAFLRREEIRTVTSVGFTRQRDDGCVLSALYYGPLHKHSRHTLSLWVNAVPSEMRKKVEELIANSALPELAKWLRSFDDASLMRSRMNQSISFFLKRCPTGQASPNTIANLRLIRRE